LTSLPNASSSLSLVKADLLDRPEKWEEIIEGCDYVLHTASPFILKPKDAHKDLVVPALKGTENVLLAVAKSKTVKVRGGEGAKKAGAERQQHIAFLSP